MSNKSDNKKIKTLLGFPIRWEKENLFKNFWNKNDSQIFPPKYFGIGWDINLYSLLKKIRFPKKKL